jgi:repressor LexA
MGITPKQKEILDYIIGFTHKHGFAPSQHEIAAHFKFRSLGTVQSYLVRLKEQGYLEQSWNSKRGIKVVEQNRGLQLVGRVAAGKPIEALEDPEDIDVPVSMLKDGGDYFALKVSGDSMIGDGILDGDVVVVRRQADAVNGQTVIAVIEDEATIKRYYRKRSHVELHPANPTYKPIVVKPEQSFYIAGVLSGVLRQL